jgi:hypothetical protein
VLHKQDMNFTCVTQVFHSQNILQLHTFPWSAPNLTEMNTCSDNNMHRCVNVKQLTAKHLIYPVPQTTVLFVWKKDEVIFLYNMPK